MCVSVHFAAQMLLHRQKHSAASLKVRHSRTENVCFWGSGVDSWLVSFCSWRRRAAGRHLWRHQKLMNLCVFWVTFTEFIKSCWSDFMSEFKGTRSSQTFPPDASWALSHKGTHTVIHSSTGHRNLCVSLHVFTTSGLMFCAVSPRTALMKQPPQRKRRFWHDSLTFMTFLNNIFSSETFKAEHDDRGGATFNLVSVCFWRCESVSGGFSFLCERSPPSAVCRVRFLTQMYLLCGAICCLTTI